jgi:hypothetical protein
MPLFRLQLTDPATQHCELRLPPREKRQDRRGEAWTQSAVYRGFRFPHRCDVLRPLFLSMVWSLRT